MKLGVCTGFSRLPPDALQFEEVIFNGKSLTIQGIEKGPIDVSRTWIPSIESKLGIKYRLNEEIFVSRIPKVEGDEFFIHLRTICNGTKEQKTSEARVLSNLGTLELTFDKFSLSDSITIFVEIFVKIRDKSDARPINAARKSHSILLSNQFKLRLTGDESQISVFSSSFDNTEFEDALWDIVLDLPSNIDLWSTLDQSEVITVRVNEKLDPKFLESEETLTLLLSEVTLLSISKFMDNEEAMYLLDNEVNAASWLSFVRENCKVAFMGEISKQVIWRNYKELVARRIQSVAAENISRAHKRIWAAGARND